MSNDRKPDFLDWLALRRDPDWSKARWFGALLIITVLLLFFMALAVVLGILGHALFGWNIDAPRFGFGTGAVALALLTAPFVMWRSVVAQKTVNVQEQGQITDRITWAVEGLGVEKTVKVREFVPRYKRKRAERPGS